MRIPRLLTILGPAVVLYVLAARAALDIAMPFEWLVAVFSLGLSLSPLALLSARRGSRGTSRLALLGVCLAVAVASAGTPSMVLDRVHGMSWLSAALVMLDLALPKGTRSLMRGLILGAFAGAAIVGAGLASAKLLPEPTFGVVVVAGIIATAALHQVVLVGRGHVVEGALSGIALVSLAVGLAYSWFGPFDGLLGIMVEFGIATLLWLGHLAWIDPRWRSLRRVGVPFMAACGLTFAAAFVLAASSPSERWQLALAAVGLGILWWMIFTSSRTLSNRAVWSRSGRLAEGASAARRSLVGGAPLEDIASGVLIPLTEALGHAHGLPEFFALQPPLRIWLDAGERVSIRSADAPPAIVRAVRVREHHGVLDLLSLRNRVVREPAIREVVDTMERRSIGCVLPCVYLDHIEGMLLLPLSDRTETLSPIELEELVRLGEFLGAAFSSALAQRRAETHIHELSALRREAEDRITTLEGELEQLRGQCDILGRGLAEDQTLHVAYSPSMRRVQTRAIELARLAEPVLLVASPGAPVLPVSRFIHDRGPRWQDPFVVADCSVAPPEQVMSLLFGFEDGHRAGWLESASGGTLLLRDLPALPLAAQARLADALAKNEHEVVTAGSTRPDHARIIATSRTPSSELRRREALDPALARRLSGSDLVIPSLRERREDVPSLALLAIDRARRILAREPVGIEQDAMGALVAHDWPGDVAELEFIMELAVGRTRGKTIRLTNLPRLAWPVSGPQDSLSGTYAEVEQRLLERALLRAGGNKSEAARMLGLKRTTFLDKLRRHGLEKRAPHSMGGSAVG